MGWLVWSYAISTAILILALGHFYSDWNHWRREAEEALDTAERATKLVAKWRSEAHRRIYQ